MTEGRRKEFAGFAAFADPARRERIPDPQAESTFRRSVLDWERARGQRRGATTCIGRCSACAATTRCCGSRTGRRRAPVPSTPTCWRSVAGTTDAERLLLANFGDDPVKLDAAGLKQFGLKEVSGWQVVYATPNAVSSDLPNGIDYATVPPRAALLLAR